MDFFDAAILGIIEGLTEFLPVSSTGHLIVASQWLGVVQTGNNKAFEVIIQLAAILAVVANYKDKFRPEYSALWLKLSLAFVPVGAVGLLFHQQIKALFSVPVVAVMFILGGIVFLGVEYMQRNRTPLVFKVEQVSYYQALLIGIAQVFALIPGTSRAGSTIVGALLVGLSRKASAEFSFLLAVPVMLAASSFDLLKNYQAFSKAELTSLLVGFVVSVVVAYFSMKLFIRFLEYFTFVAFGIYRILFGILLLVLF